MASTNVPLRGDALRLQCLTQLCSQIASDINTARRVLSANGEDADVAYLVVAALKRIGWVADRATLVAGENAPPTILVGGDAEGWMLDPTVLAALEQLKAEAPHHG